MNKVSRDSLLRMEWIKVDYYANYEIWAYDNERIIWNPKTEEIVSKYQIKEGSSDEKNE